MHTHRDRSKLMLRVRRLRGQLEAIERAIDERHDCEQMLHQIAACRGAINGLMAQVLDGHIREHIIDPNRRPTNAETQSPETLAAVLKSCLK